MMKKFHIFLSNLVLILGKEPELPECPTNIQFFPQTLPMHCRMARSTDSQPPLPGLPSGVAPLPPPYYQSPPPDKQPQPIPIPIQPLPGPFPFPGGPMSGVPMPSPLPGPMPMPVPGPAHKLPVIVMPFYSPDPSFKKPRPPSKVLPAQESQGPSHHRRPKFGHIKKYPGHYSDSDTDSTDLSSDFSSDTSSDFSNEYNWWKRRSSRKVGRRSNRKHGHSRKDKIRHSKKKKELLTPVLQYVTKDGYVIFEKQISKNEAKDWLAVKDGKKNKSGDDKEENSGEDGELPVKVKVISKEENRSQEDNNTNHKKLYQTNNKRLEQSTEKPHKKHQRRKPNLLLDSIKS